MPTVRDALIDLGDDLKGVRLAPPSAVRARGDQRRRWQHSGAIISTTAVASAITVVAIGVPTGRFAATGVSPGSPAATCYSYTRFTAPEPQQADSAMIIISWSGTPDAETVSRARALPGVRAVTAASPEKVATWTTYEQDCTATIVSQATPAVPGGMLVVEVNRTYLDDVSNELSGVTNGRGPTIIQRGEPPWCGLEEGIDDFTALVQVAMDATTTQREAIAATLGKEWQVSEVEFQESTPDNGGDPQCGYLEKLGPYFWVRLKTNHGFPEVRDAVTGLPGVVGFVAPSTRFK